LIDEVSTPLGLREVPTIRLAELSVLAFLFAWHVFWPVATPDAPFAGPFEWPSLCIAAAALIALWRFKSVSFRCLRRALRLI
jgi:hypothetical protein